MQQDSLADLSSENFRPNFDSDSSESSASPKICFKLRRCNSNESCTRASARPDTPISAHQRPPHVIRKRSSKLLNESKPNLIPETSENLQTQQASQKESESIPEEECEQTSLFESLFDLKEEEEEEICTSEDNSSMIITDNHSYKNNESSSSNFTSEEKTRTLKRTFDRNLVCFAEEKTESPREKKSLENPDLHETVNFKKISDLPVEKIFVESTQRQSPIPVQDHLLDIIVEPLDHKETSEETEGEEGESPQNSESERNKRRETSFKNRNCVLGETDHLLEEGLDPSDNRLLDIIFEPIKSPEENLKSTNSPRRKY